MRTLKSIHHWAVSTAFLTIISLPITVIAAEKLVESVVAIVNEKPILLSEFEQAWRLQVANLKGNINNEKVLKKRLIEHLVMLRLQNESAEKNGIRVNERELNASIDVIAQRNNLSLKGLYSQAAKQGLSLQAFRENIRQQLVAQRLQNQLFANRIQISETEVDEVLARENALNDPLEYKIKTLLIKPAANNKQAWQKAKENISKVQSEIVAGQSFDEAIALYSDSNADLNNNNLQWQDASSIPDLFHKALLQLDKEQISQPIKTGRGYFLLQLIDKQFKQKVQSYQYQLERILLPNGSYNEFDVLAIEQEIEAQLKSNPKSFATLAEKYSKDRYAQSGGKTDWLKPSDIEPALAVQLNNQQISNKLKKILLQQGWILYRVVDRKSYDASEEAIRQQIKQRLTYLKIQSEYDEFLRNLRLHSAVQINL